MSFNPLPNFYTRRVPDSPIGRSMAEAAAAKEHGEANHKHETDLSDEIALLRHFLRQVVERVTGQETLQESVALLRAVSNAVTVISRTARAHQALAAGHFAPHARPSATPMSSSPMSSSPSPFSPSVSDEDACGPFHPSRSPFNTNSGPVPSSPGPINPRQPIVPPPRLGTVRYTRAPANGLDPYPRVAFFGGPDP